VVNADFVTDESRDHSILRSTVQCHNLFGELSNLKAGDVGRPCKLSFPKLAFVMLLILSLEKRCSKATTQRGQTACIGGN
jgi:hypothetical protein